jgi:hypothetical protein
MSRRVSTVSNMSSLSRLSISSPRQSLSDLSNRVRSFGQSKYPLIKINLAPRSNPKATAYTTMDRIEGQIEIAPTQDTPFDSINIIFEGMALTYIERLSPSASVPSKVSATHRFMVLPQPADESLLPEDRIARAGAVYKFPFHFVVPQRLLPKGCIHSRELGIPHEAHLLLPPSLSDPESIPEGVSLKDDMGPEMAKITYQIRVMMNRRNDFGQTVVVAEKARKIRVIPASEEAPPVDFSTNKDYCLETSTTVKKNMFSGRTGTLYAKADQPRSLHLLPPDSGSDVMPMTTALVQLKFVPSKADQQPPKLGTLATRLKSNTWFWSRPMTDTMPTKSQLAYDRNIGCYTVTMNLSSRRISNVQWLFHEPEEASEDLRWGYYTAELPVPVALPKNKSFVPSFQTCTSSRAYVLCIGLSTTPATSDEIELKIPVQVSVEQSACALQAGTEAQQQAEDENFEAMFVPRSITPPDDEFVNRSSFSSNRLSPRSEMPPQPTRRQSNPQHEPMPVPQSAEAARAQLPEWMRRNTIQFEASGAAAPAAQVPSHGASGSNDADLPGYSFFGVQSGLIGRIPEPRGVSPGCG